MLTSSVKTLSCKLLTLSILVATLFIFLSVAPRSTVAQFTCAAEVYDYCWSQNRPVDSTTCTCNLQYCLSPLSIDCTEVGNYFDAETCTCVGNPSEVSLCASDPYAQGCPRAFDTVFAGQMRARQGCDYPGSENDPGCDPMIGGGSDDICSFESFSWCASSGGSWSSYGCSCSGVTGSSGAQTACANAGGTWYNPGNTYGGGSCYNPSGIGDGWQCGTSTQTLSSCVSTGGRWNPYNCTCTPS